MTQSQQEVARWLLDKTPAVEDNAPLAVPLTAGEIRALCNAVLAGQRMGDFLGEAHVLTGADRRPG